MEREEKDKSKERVTDRKGKPDRRFLTVTGWPTPDRRKSSLREMPIIISGNGESMDHIMATYWG